MKSREAIKMAVEVEGEASNIRRLKNFLQNFEHLINEAEELMFKSIDLREDFKGSNKKRKYLVKLKETGCYSYSLEKKIFFKKNYGKFVATKNTIFWKEVPFTDKSNK